jgi:general nucleoside transport system permease protein
MSGQSRLLRGAHKTVTGLNPVLESILAGIVGLLIGALLMYIWGFNPWRAYIALFKGAYGGTYELSSSIARGTPLVLTALTFSICLRAGMFNIGAEGQMMVGAIAAITIALFVLPTGVHTIVGLIFAALAGAVWSIVPAVLKVTRGVSEVISTIMFNWIGRFLVIWLGIHVLVDPIRSEKTLAIPKWARFPVIVKGTDLTASVYLAVGVALIIYFLLWHTTVGYEVRAAGLNPTAARYGGIRSKRTMMLAFVLGGMTAGLGGAALVMGLPPSYAIFSSGMPNLTNIGFDGMAVAMVGRNHPIGILFAALFFGGLNAGGRVMQFYGSNPVPLEMVRIVMGAIVLAMSIPELLRLFPAIKKSMANLLTALRGRRQAAPGEES